MSIRSAGQYSLGVEVVLGSQSKTIASLPISVGIEGVQPQVRHSPAIQ
jgi:hypothetical protein